MKLDPGAKITVLRYLADNGISGIIEKCLVDSGAAYRIVRAFDNMEPQIQNYFITLDLCDMISTAVEFIKNKGIKL